MDKSLLDQWREADPSFANMTDVELASAIHQVYGRGTEFSDFSNTYGLGVKIDDPGTLTSFQNSLYGLAEFGGQLAHDFVPGMEDNALERWGRGGMQRNPTTIMQGESDSAFTNLATNLASDPLGTGGQILGQAAGLMLPGLGWARGAKLAAGAASLRGANTTASVLRGAGTAGETAIYGGPSATQFRNADEAAGRDDPSDLARSYGLGLGSGAIESRFGPEAILGRGKLAPFVDAYAGKNFARTGLKTGAIEAGEEVLQAPLEQMGMHQDVFSLDTLDNAAAGALAGFVGGAPMGAALHPFMPRRTVAPGSSEPTQLLGGQSDFAGADLDPDRFMAEQAALRAAQQPYVNEVNFGLGLQRDAVGRQAQIDQYDFNPYTRQGAPLQPGQAYDLFEGTARDVPNTLEASVEYAGPNQTPVNRRQMPLDLSPENAPLYGTDMGENYRPGVTFNQLPITDEYRPANRGQSPFVMARTAYQEAGGTARGWLNLAKKYQLSSASSPDEVAAAIRDKAVNGKLLSSAAVESLEQAHSAVLGQSIGDVLNAQEKQNDVRETLPPGGGSQALIRPEVQAAQAPQSLGAAQQGGQEQELSRALSKVAERLSPQQKTIFGVLSSAAQNNDLDNFVMSNGQMRYQAIADAAGIERNAAKVQIDRTMKKITALAGFDVKTALADRAKAVRTNIASDYEALGMSPAVQPSVVDERELFGEAGDSGMGTINSLGGSQIETGEDKAATEMAAARPDPVYEKRVAEAKAQREAETNAILASPEAAEAARDWEDQKSDGAVGADGLSRDDAREWVFEYWSWKNGEITEEELSARQREIERRYDASAPRALQGKPGADFTERAGADEAAGGANEDFQSSGQDRADERPATHTQESLTQLLVGKFGAGMRQAIQTGRVKVLASQEEANKVTGQKSGTVFYQGLYDPNTDTVYFVAGNISEQVQGLDGLSIALHEIGEHAGLERFLGGYYDTLRGAVARAMRVAAPNTEFERAVQAATKKLLPSQRGDTQEVLAYLIQHTPEVGPIKQVWSRIKAWAFRHGLAGDAALDQHVVRELAKGATRKWLAEGGVASAAPALASGSHQSYQLTPTEIGFKNHELEFEQAGSTVQNGIQHFDVYDAEGFPVGLVSVQMRHGKIVALVNIKADEQRKGWGEKITRALVDTAPAEGLYIHDMVPKAIGFWQKMGVLPEEGGKWDHGNGTLTSQRYREARADAGRDTQGAAGSRQAVGDSGIQVEEIPAHDIKLSGRAEAIERVEREIARAWSKSHGRETLQKYGPMLLTLHQLRDVFGNKLTKLKDYVAATDTMSMDRQRLTNKGHRILESWVALPKATQTLLHKVMLDATLRGIHPDLAFDHEENRLSASQRSQYEELRSRYQALPPAAQEVYQKAKNTLAELWAERRTSFEKLVRAKYGERIAAATDADKQAALTEEMDKYLADYDKAFKEIKGPYFPLMRFGDYVAVSRSDELAALEAKLDDEDADHTGLSKKIAELRKDPKHYVVRAFKRQVQAEDFAAGQRGKGFNSYAMKADEYHSQFRPFGAEGLNSITDQLTSQFDKDTAAKLKDLLTHIYVASLPEHAALQRQLRREGIEGASDDMLRAFGEVVEKDAFYISRMKHGEELTSLLFAMKREASALQRVNDADGIKVKHVYDNLLARAALDMQYKPTPMQSLLARASSVFHLGIAPAFLLTNTTQPWMITVPQLAGKYGIGRAFGAMRSAWSDSGRIIKEGKGGVFNLRDVDLTEVKDPTERAMLQHISDLGQFDITITHDMGAVAEGMSPQLHKYMRMFNWATQHIELHNRVSTALAAYRLSKSAGADEAKARSEALDAVVMTQLDYSGTNTAYFMKQGVGPLGNMNKLVYQFRKYQQGMIFLLLRDAQLAWRGDKEAARSLFYLVGAQVAIAGATGIPVLAPVLFALGAFGDDDDERGDLETRWRNELTDMVGPEMARAMWKGLPTMLGLDVSKNLGMGDLFKPLPMLRWDSVSQAKSAKDSMGQIAVEALGAPAGMMASIWDGMSAMARGDVMTGLEKAMPRFIRNPIKATEYATKGLATKSGTQVFEPDQFDNWDLAYRALGFSTTKETEHYDAQAAKENISSALDDRKKEIFADYARARRSGGGIEPVLESVRAFNAAHPSQKIKRDALERAVRARQKATGSMDSAGVQFRKNERSLKDVTRFAED